MIATTTTRAPLSSSKTGGRQGLTEGGAEARPFVKCLGGKAKLAEAIIARIPRSFDPYANAYFEPFVGGGALFFALQPPRHAFLGDANPHLIATYTAVQNDVEGLIKKLKGPRYANREKRFYEIRKTAFKTPSQVAAEYIYLNKTAYGGVFRVNRDGGFNVPFGHYKDPVICDEENLRACSRALRNARFQAGDFEGTLRMGNVKKGDLVYFDCPYWPRSETSDFTSYTKEGFGINEQVRLHRVALSLKKKGVHVILSNADVREVRELYRKDFKIERIQAARSINSNTSKRGKIGELIIT